uniref:Uncharacterized protein n=1 Tax=Kalanchoe fedtschenkoi TaxID=63787 RepID=A0A7N0VB11_KALFE
MLAADSKSLDSGHAHLHVHGYEQKLNRDLSVLSNFSFSFSIVSGITALYNIGLTYAGAVLIVYGWLVAGIFTLIVGLSMSEICSSLPAFGWLYYWSAKVAGPNWGPLASWLTGWFNIIGQWAFTTCTCTDDLRNDSTSYSWEEWWWL